MVLEALFPAKEIINKPLDMILLSVIISLASPIISYYIFPAYAGVISPLLITVAITPIIYRIFSDTEKIEEEVAEKKIQKNYFDRYFEIILLFTLFFIGNFISTFILMVLLPESFITVAFGSQINEIASIHSISGYAISGSMLNLVVTNNLKVMLFSFLLSFIFGTGAIFILSWNASILAVYFANFLRAGLYKEALIRAAGIAPHTPVEILAYFLAGIAGGILSVGIIREKLWSKEFFIVLRDSILMLGIAVAAVIFGAFLEVYF